MRRVVQTNDRARAKRMLRAALKRANRLKVAREHAAGRKFRMRLADSVDSPLAKANPGKRAAVANQMPAVSGFARLVGALR